MDVNKMLKELIGLQKETGYGSKITISLDGNNDFVLGSGEGLDYSENYGEYIEDALIEAIEMFRELKEELEKSL